jgi:ATP-dependent Clp protease ATP-binding subunit ClpC
MYERFTDKARKALSLANVEAKRLRHAELEPHHLLVGLVEESESIGGAYLIHKGFNSAELRKIIEPFISPGNTDCPDRLLPVSEKWKKISLAAIEHARKLNDNYVGTEHLVLALLNDAPWTLAAKILVEAGCSEGELLNFRTSSTLKLKDATSEERLSKICNVLADYVGGKLQPLDALLKISCWTDLT